MINLPFAALPIFRFAACWFLMRFLLGLDLGIFKKNCHPISSFPKALDLLSHLHFPQL